MYKGCLGNWQLCFINCRVSSGSRLTVKDARKRENMLGFSSFLSMLAATKKILYYIGVRKKLEKRVWLCTHDEVTRNALCCGSVGLAADAC